jgi:hypothetical protein
MTIFILFIHFIADFVLQTDAMARNKSTSNKFLLNHVAVYTACLGLFGLEFALVNGVAHFAIDWCTSRLSSKMWKAGRTHDFFVVIGFDQFLHMAILISTIELVNTWWWS